MGVQRGNDTLLQEGELVFSRTFPRISRHTLALYCGASGDTNPIHVDSDYARDAGFDDVFAHGMLLMGYLGTALEEAGSPEALRSFSARFVAMTQLGATITCEGRVQSRDGGLMTLSLLARDQRGETKLTGTAVVDYASWRK